MVILLPTTKPLLEAANVAPENRRTFTRDDRVRPTDIGDITVIRPPFAERRLTLEADTLPSGQEAPSMEELS